MRLLYAINALFRIIVCYWRNARVATLRIANQSKSIFLQANLHRKLPTSWVLLILRNSGTWPRLEPWL